MVLTNDVNLALVKDWLTSYGGSEEQLWQIHQMYPNAPIYTSVYDKKRLPQFARAKIHTMNLPSFMAKGRRFEKLAWLLPHYFSRLDLSNFDVVISVTSGFAKGVHTSKKCQHLSICNTPIRFAWNLGGDRRGFLGRLTSPYFRWYDVQSSKGVDVFYANSKNVQRRIEQIYDRSSEVLYPPVKVEEFTKIKRVKNPVGYITIGRLVPYKRVDIIIKACNKLKVPLTVIGTGPEEKTLKQLAGPQVCFLGFADEKIIKQELAKAKAFIFAAEEDFGIAPVEAMAAGCPVIALGKGGAKETVIDGKTGLWFKKQNVDSLRKILSAEWPSFDTTVLRKQADKFSVKHFRSKVKQAIDRALI